MPLSQVTQFQIGTKLGVVYIDGEHKDLINGVKFESHKMKSIRIKDDMSFEELKTIIQQKGGDESRILRSIFYRRPEPAYGSVEYVSMEIITDLCVQNMLAQYMSFRSKGPIELSAKFARRIDIERQNELSPWPPGSVLSYIYYRCGIVNARDGVKFVAFDSNPPEPLRLQHNITFEELKQKIHHKLRLEQHVISTIKHRYPRYDREGRCMWSMYDVLTTNHVRSIISHHCRHSYSDFPIELCIRTTLAPSVDPPVTRSVEEIMELFREPQ